MVELAIEVNESISPIDSLQNQTEVFSGDSTIIEIHEDTEDVLLDLTQAPGLFVLTGDDFTRAIAANNSAYFKPCIEERNGKPFIWHDHQQIHYFAEKRVAWHHMFTTTESKPPKVVNAEWYDIKVNTLEELRELRANFLTIPFVVEFYLEAVRVCCAKVYSLPRVGVVATVNPYNTKMNGMLTKAFDEAEERMKNNGNFSIEINFKPALKLWYLDQLRAATDEEWILDSTGRHHISIYNHSARFVLLQNDPLVFFAGMCFCVSILWCGFYRMYRNFTCSTIKVEISEPPEYNIFV